MRKHYPLLLVLAVALLTVYGCFDDKAVEPTSQTNINPQAGAALVSDAPCIGDFVWFDQNANGCQDEGEPGIEGIFIELYTCGDVLVDSQTSGVDGYYCFVDLEPGSYYLKFHEFGPLFLTYKHACEADRNSDADQDTGKTACYDVGEGDCIKRADAGYCIKPDEGCTPGYWKNQTECWPEGINPSDSYNTTFGCSIFSPDLTLLEALRQGGGGFKALGRHSVAALLNALHPSVDYPADAGDIKTAVCNVVNPGGLKDILAELNEAGCSINAHCEENGDDDEGDSARGTRLTQ